jgi:hypothetical protein
MFTITSICLIASVKISVTTKVAKINCVDGRSISQQVVIGNPRAKNVLDRTPLGTHKVSEVLNDQTGYMQGAAKFKTYQTTPNKNGETEVGYYVHGFLPESYGQGDKAQQLKGNSIGCVRMNMEGIRFKVGSLVIVGK